MIKIKSLYKKYETGKHPVVPVQDINLNIEDKSFLVIRGESGSGKSTLLNIIGGLLRPSSGEIEVQGELITSLNDNQLADYRNSVYGFIFQNYNLIPYLSAQDNIIISLRIKGWGKKKAVKRAKELLKQLGLEHRMDISPNSLSGGEQQRVAIARAIAHHPSVILADEPTGNLDSKNAKEVLEMLLDLHKNEKNIIILVSHSDDVAKKASILYQLQDGKLLKKK